VAGRAVAAARTRSAAVAAPLATPLAGATAVVTGGSRGIGRATVRALAATGARVVSVSRSADREPAAGVLAVAADLLDPASAARAVGEIERVLGGPPDVLVNNAGCFDLAPVEDTSSAMLASALTLNLAAPFALIRAFLPGMRARRRGHIVSIGSIADHIAFPGNAAYAASKFGMRGLHEVLRAEIGGSGVRASLISPAAVGTTIWDTLDPATRARLPDAAAMLDPSAVADAVLFAVTRPEAVSVDEIRLSRS